MTALTLFPLPQSTVASEGVSDWPSDAFDQFWEKYPRKVAKLAAQRAFAKAKKSGAPWPAFMQAVLRYAAGVDGKDQQYTKHPATWLNGGCWDDEPAAPSRQEQNRRPSFVDIARGLA